MSNEPVVAGIINIEDFLLISQPLKYFEKSLEVSQSLINPNKIKQKMFGDSERQASQIRQAMSILRISC
jgi:hypothetical protein